MSYTHRPPRPSTRRQSRQTRQTGETKCLAGPFGFVESVDFVDFVDGLYVYGTVQAQRLSHEMAQGGFGDKGGADTALHRLRSLERHGCCHGHDLRLPVAWSQSRCRRCESHRPQKSRGRNRVREQPAVLVRRLSLCDHEQPSHTQQAWSRYRPGRG